MTIELNFSLENKIWQPLELPEHRKVVRRRCLFALNKGENGGKVTCKSRSVATGFIQVFDSNHLQNFAPTAELSSIYMFLALATFVTYEVYQFDVSSAYLNVNLDEDVFVDQTPAFEVPGHVSNSICKLLKGLYGLKQGGHCWSRTLARFVAEFFLLTRSMFDSCWHSKSNLFCDRFSINAWVDDKFYY